MFVDGKDRDDIRYVDFRELKDGDTVEINGFKVELKIKAEFREDGSFIKGSPKRRYHVLTPHGNQWKCSGGYGTSHFTILHTTKELQRFTTGEVSELINCTPDNCAQEADKHSAIMWQELIDEFDEKVHFYLKYPDKAIQIGKNGYEHALKYHTTEKRMEYIFDIIQEKLKWEI